MLDVAAKPPLAIFLFAVTAAHAEDLRQWNLPGVTPFQAELVAADGLHATLLVPAAARPSFLLPG